MNLMYIRKNTTYNSNAINSKLKGFATAFLFLSVQLVSQCAQAGTIVFDITGYGGFGNDVVHVEFDTTSGGITSFSGVENDDYDGDYNEPFLNPTGLYSPAAFNLSFDDNDGNTGWLFTGNLVNNAWQYAGHNGEWGDSYTRFDALQTGDSPINVPEPESIAMIGLGLLGFGVSRKRKSQMQA